MRLGSTTPSASRQSNTSPEPGLAPSISSQSAPNESNRDTVRSPAGSPDGERHALGHPSGVLGALVPVELHGAEPDLVRHLDDACGRLVTEHADGQHLVGQALHDVGHRRDRDLPRGGAKMKPTASAPSPTAKRASASEVMPQILMKISPSSGRSTTRSRLCSRREATGAPSSARTASAGRRLARGARRRAPRRSPPPPGGLRQPRRRSPTRRPRSRPRGSLRRGARRARCRPQR